MDLPGIPVCQHYFKCSYIEVPSELLPVTLQDLNTVSKKVLKTLLHKVI